MSDSDATPGQLVVEARGLCRDFGATRAVDCLDLDIPRGTIYGLLGPNGSGKTTAMRMLTGLLTPSAGSARVLGVTLPGRAELLKSRIGYMTQGFTLYRDLTVLENLRFVADIYGLGLRQKRARIATLLNTYALNAIRDVRAGSLSGGQRQRLALAAAVLHQPGLLFLDEPTSAVDPESRRLFWEQLFDLVDGGVSIVVSTHFMDEAERCHRIAILDRGLKRADGTPREMMDAIAGRVVLVEGSDLRRAGRALSGAPGILSVAQVGARLRVLVRAKVADPLATVTATLKDASGVSASLVPANLEDVFVHATKDAAS